MRLRLPVLILLSVICFLFFIPSPLAAQEASPTASPVAVSASTNPLIEFFKNLLAAIKGRKVDTTLEDFNKASLPNSAKVIPAKQPKEEETKGESFKTAGEDGEDEEKMPDIDPIYNAASQYTVASGVQTPKIGEEKRSTNVADSFAGIVNNPEKVVEKGNQEAIKLADGQLPMGVTEKALSRVRQSPGIADNISGRSAQVLGYTTFSGNNSVMPDVLSLLQCANLPYIPDNRLCQNIVPTRIPEQPQEPVPSPTIEIPPITPPPSTTPYPTPSGRCSLGTGYCSVESLRNHIKEIFALKDEEIEESSLIKASIICNQESHGNPFEPNEGCLKGKSVDYSIGLFQINLLAHCPGAFSSYTWDPPSCTIGDIDKLNECKNKYFDVRENIKKAWEMSGRGSDWSAWGAARYCGII